MFPVDKVLQYPLERSHEPQTAGRLTTCYSGVHLQGRMNEKREQPREPCRAVPSLPVEKRILPHRVTVDEILQRVLDDPLNRSSTASLQVEQKHHRVRHCLYHETDRCRHIAAPGTARRP